jgi:hypothetical protein
LLDLTKVSLINCGRPSVSASVHHGADGPNPEGYHYAKVFPHFVILGNRHLHPADPTISRVEFLIDDANTLFYDFEAFGWLLDARPYIHQIANADLTDRPIAIGPNPQIFYFSGKMRFSQSPPTWELYL